MSISYEGLESRLAEVEGEIERMQEAIEKLEAEKVKLGRWMEMFRTEELPVLSKPKAKAKNSSKGGWNKLTDEQRKARLEKLRLARESKKAKAKAEASVLALSLDDDDLGDEIEVDE